MKRLVHNVPLFGGGKALGAGLIAAFLVMGCGGNNPGPTGSVGANGEFSFSMYWGADTRSLEIDAWSIRITAARQDGTGTPVTMVVNRPDNIDTPQAVLLPGRFLVGQHRIDFRVFSEPNGQGREIGIGGMSRRLVPNSRNNVRVNIGAIRGLTSARGVVSTELQAGVPFRVSLDTQPTFGSGTAPVENEVNLLEGQDLSLDLNGGVTATKLGADQFRIDRPGYYNVQFRLEGRVVSAQRAVVRNTQPPGPEPVAQSPWPTSEGPVTRARTAPTSAPVALGTPRVSTGTIAPGTVERSVMAVLASGDVAVTAEGSGFMRVALFAGDLSRIIWSISLPTGQGPLVQIAALRNGLILVQERAHLRALNAANGQVDWIQPVGGLLPLPLYQNYIIAGSKFLSLGSGQTAFESAAFPTMVLPDGTAISGSGLTHLSSPNATYSELNGGRIADLANEIIIDENRIFSYRDLKRISLPSQPVVGLVPGQPSEWIGYQSGRHWLLRSSNRSSIRDMDSDTRGDIQVAFQNRVLVAIALNGNPVAFNLDTGAELWRSNAEVASLAAGQNRVYALRTDGRLLMIGP